MRRPPADAELAEVASQLGRALRAGATLPVALAEVTASGRLGADLDRVRSLVARGVPVDDALAAWRAARPEEGVALLVAAARMGHRLGGDPARALDGVAATLRDRAEVADEVRSLTAQARAGVAVLALLPGVGASVLSLLDPDVAGVLLGTPPGWACMGAAAGLDLAAVAACRGMVRRAVR